MQAFKDRLKIARKNAQMTQIQLAKAVGTSQGSISDLESGRNKISNNIFAFAQALKVNPYWLATGQGSMTATPAEPQLDENDFIKMEFWGSDTPLYDGEFEVPYYKDTEFLGGDGFLDENHDDGRRKLRYAYTAASRAGANPKKIVCTTLKGDSMEELILDGSMIAIDASKTDIKEGKIYAFRHGTMLRVKYLIPRPDGGLIIRSHNKKYDDEIIAGEAMEQENIQIVGWVWNWSSLVTW